jgi:hypothetical protein
MCRDLGADIVIAVDVNSAGATFFGARGPIIGVVLQAMLVVQKNSSQYQLAASDFVITPQIAHIRWDSLRRAGDLNGCRLCRRDGKHSGDSRPHRVEIREIRRSLILYTKHTILGSTEGWLADCRCQSRSPLYPISVERAIATL